MNPTEQQLKDPNWWKQHAPDGSNYYAYDSIEPWERFDGVVWSYYDRAFEKWIEMNCTSLEDRQRDTVIVLYKRPW